MTVCYLSQSSLAYYRCRVHKHKLDTRIIITQRWRDTLARASKVALACQIFPHHSGPCYVTWLQGRTYLQYVRTYYHLRYSYLLRILAWDREWTWLPATKWSCPTSASRSARWKGRRNSRLSRNIQGHKRLDRHMNFSTSLVDIESNRRTFNSMLSKTFAMRMTLWTTQWGPAWVSFDITHANMSAPNRYIFSTTIVSTRNYEEIVPSYNMTLAKLLATRQPAVLGRLNWRTT